MASRKSSLTPRLDQAPLQGSSHATPAHPGSSLSGDESLPHGTMSISRARLTGPGSPCGPAREPGTRAAESALRRGAERGQGLLTEGQQETVEHAEHPGVPALVFQVQEAVDSVAAQEREEDPRQVPERHLWGTGWGWHPCSPPSPTHTWSGRPDQGDFQVALGTLDLDRKYTRQARNTGGCDSGHKEWLGRQWAGRCPGPPPRTAHLLVQGCVGA